MKKTVNEYEFRRAFETLHPDNFTYEGLGALFEHLEDFEEDTGEELELDVIAICCDYTQYSFEEAKEEFGPYYPEVAEADTMDDLVDALSDYTYVIPVGCQSIIISVF